MTGEDRREDILLRISESETPVTARALADIYGVSRQVIVQDIALIAGGRPSDPVYEPGAYPSAERMEPAVRVFKVCHTDEQLEDELA